MRLHEFTDHDYSLPATGEAAIVQEIEKCWRAYTNSDAKTRLTNKQTKNSVPPTTVSV